MPNRDEQIRELLEKVKAAMRSKNHSNCHTCIKRLDQAIALLKEQPCETCGGSKKCPTCKGTGDDPESSGCKMCWRCGGKGNCPDCGEKIYKKAGQEIPNRLKMKS